MNSDGADETRGRGAGIPVHPADQARVPARSSSGTSVPRSAGLDSMPAAGGALVVSNHSGGMFTPDVLVFAPAFYDKFGFDRPVYTLAHSGCSSGRSPSGCAALGVIEASRRTRPRRCDPTRSCWSSLAGTTTRTGRRSPRTSSTSPDAPAMSEPRSRPACRSFPMVSIGAQETQLFLARGDSIARRLGLTAGTHGDPADEHRVPVRAFHDLPAESALAVQDRSPGCSNRST